MRSFLLAASLFAATSVCCAVEYTVVTTPRGTSAEQYKIYEPLLDYLSKKTGASFKFVYIKDWLSYRKAVFDNKYDIYFNDPHFSSFLVEFREHKYIAKLKERHTFIVMASTYNKKVSELMDLAGRYSCLLPEPNLETLLFLAQFKNAMRQPALRTNVVESGEMYKAVMKNRCEAAVMPYDAFSKLNAEHPEEATIVYTFNPVPNHTFTAGPRVPEQVVEQLKAVLTQPNLDKEVQALLVSHASKGIVMVDPGEYKSLYRILQNDFLLGREIVGPGQNQKTKATENNPSR